MDGQTVFFSKDYSRSRGAYTAQCAFEYFISLLSADAFLAKVLKDIGMSDALTGLLSSLISVTFLFQLLSVPLAGKLRKVKKPIIALDTASQLLFASLYTVPLLPLSVGAKTVLSVGVILAAYLTLYLNTAVCYKWGNSFVFPDKRGDFSATKEMISLVSGVFVSLGAGWVIDRFEKSENLHGGFVFLAGAMVVVCGFNFLCLALMKDTSLPESGAKQNVKEIFSRTLINKNCRNAIILTALSDFARYFSTGFMGTYKTVDLGFSVSQIQLMNVAGHMSRFAVSKPFGRLSDRRSYADGYFFGNLINIATYALGALTTVKTRWLILPFVILQNMSMAGISQNTYNMMYSYTDSEYILPAMTVNNSIRGVAGFAASLLGSAVVNRVQANGSKVFGLPVRAQQLLCGISGILTAVSLVFNKKVVCRQQEEKK